MKDQLERPKYENLEDYGSWIENESLSEIRAKQAAYEWIQKSGEELAQMTSGKEKKELLRITKEVKLKWAEINELVETRQAKVNHLLQVRRMELINQYDNYFGGSCILMTG
jgi:hypothetical protein